MLLALNGLDSNRKYQVLSFKKAKVTIFPGLASRVFF